MGTNNKSKRTITLDQSNGDCFEPSDVRELSRQEIQNYGEIGTQIPSATNAFQTMADKAPTIIGRKDFRIQMEEELEGNKLTRRLQIEAEGNSQVVGGNTTTSGASIGWVFAGLLLVLLFAAILFLALVPSLPANFKTSGSDETKEETSFHTDARPSGNPLQKPSVPPPEGLAPQGENRIASQGSKSLASPRPNGFALQPSNGLASKRSKGFASQQPEGLQPTNGSLVVPAVSLTGIAVDDQPHFEKHQDFRSTRPLRTVRDKKQIRKPFQSVIPTHNRKWIPSKKGRGATRGQPVRRTRIIRVYMDEPVTRKQCRKQVASQYVR